MTPSEAMFKALDLWSTYFFSRAGPAFVFPTVIAELSDLLSPLASAFGAELADVFDYLREFRSKYDGVTVGRKDPFNNAMLLFFLSKRAALPEEGQVLLDTLVDQLRASG